MNLPSLKHVEVFWNGLPNIQTFQQHSKFQFNVSDKSESLEAPFGSSSSFEAPQFHLLLGLLES